MTDITELAQSLKAAAEKATPGPWHLSNENKLLIRDEDGVWIAHVGYFDSPTEISDGEFIALANPVNIIALVEALEKAQESETQAAEIAVQLSKRLAEAYKRIAELESRTVTVKLPEVRITVAESRRRNMTWRELGAYNEGADVAAERIGKELTAQGIKWEAE